MRDETGDSARLPKLESAHAAPAPKQLRAWVVRLWTKNIVAGRRPGHLIAVRNYQAKVEDAKRNQAEMRLEQPLLERNNRLL
jgi:hypothetical protein